MFKYQLHKLSKGGRSARAVLLEDILTSDVFGLMTYLPYNMLLKQFMELVRMKNPLAGISIPDGKPKQINFWKSFPWPDDIPYLGRNSIEPDVVIEWDNLLIIVEAKFISPTDPEELLREYLIGSIEAGSGKQFYLLQIDKNLSPLDVVHRETYDRVSVSKYIENRVLELDLSQIFPTNKIRSSVLWINWQGVYSLIDGMLQIAGNKTLDNNVKPYENFLKDLLLVLDRKGLIPFEKLTLQEFKKWQIDLSLIGEIGLLLRSSFSDLSDISIDLDCLGKIGLKLSDPVPFLSVCEVNIDDINSQLKL